MREIHIPPSSRNNGSDRALVEDYEAVYGAAAVENGASFYAEVEKWASTVELVFTWI